MPPRSIPILATRGSGKIQRVIQTEVAKKAGRARKRASKLTLSDAARISRLVDPGTGKLPIVSARGVEIGRQRPFTPPKATPPKGVSSPGWPLPRNPMPRKKRRPKPVAAGFGITDIFQGAGDLLRSSDPCAELPMLLQGACRSLTGGLGGAADCPEGSIKVGNRCVAPGDVFPGGDPFITGAGGQAVEGSFGLPAITPTVEQRTHRTCPDGMVLGTDDLCYPRAILSRRNKFRKWKQPPRPPVSAADAKALRKIDSIRSKIRSMGKKADLKVTKR